LVDATDEDKKSLQEDLDKIARQYGADGADFTKFPTFSFSGRVLSVFMVCMFYSCG